MEQRRTPAEPPTERQLLERLRETVPSVLPSGWSSELRDAPPPADAALVIRGPDGRTAELLVEAKSIVNARDVPAVRAQLRLDDDPDLAGGLVVSRYLSPRAREALSEAGMSYLDATGNLRLAVDEPAMFVVLTGADRDPWRSPDRPTNSLRGKPAARIVRTLVDVRRTWKIRELAQAAETSLGSTSRTVDFLAREALVERDESGAIIDVAWPALLQRWAADYQLIKRRRVLGLLASRGIESIEKQLRGWDGRYAVSGSMAAAQWAPYAESRLALVYTADADALQAQLGIREAPSRPNVLLIEPDDDYVFMRTGERDGLSFAAPSQVAVDLLVGPGRNPEEGRELIRWMQANEPRWRAS